MVTRTPAGLSRFSSHVLAASAFAALAVLWTTPLARHLSTHLLGAGSGDNMTFLWNVWWMRASLDAGLDFFHTTYLFAPVGADLTLHTHMALPAFVAATAFRTLPVVTSLNVMILASLCLNGFAAYLLGWRITRDHGAAMVTGLVFGGSAFIAAHLHGHFNLTTAWTIPLFALAASEALIAGSMAWSVAAGLLLGATAYIDYYYVVYQLAFALCLFAGDAREWSIARAGSTPRSRLWSRLVGIVILVDVGVLAAIGVTGGFSLDLGSLRISAHDVFNPLQALWLLGALWLWLRYRPRVRASPHRTADVHRAARALIVIIGVFLLTAGPLVWNGISLIARGEYVTQRYFWRSAPKGIDVATFLLGNPFHGLWGGSVRRVYQSLGVDAIESSGWIGIAPVVLVAWILARRRRDPSVRRWATLGGLFLVWALGPHLMAFGTNTGMILPQALLRYVPVVSNARIPGRAMVMVQLAIAVLCGIALADWRRRSARRIVPLFVALALLVDDVPAPFPLTPLDRPAIYEALRNRPERGALCELPLGIRDGFGARGFFDERVLFYQTIHERPLVGGFLARLPPAVIAFYETDPLLSTLLRLSERGGDVDPAAMPDRQRADELLNRNGIRFVMLNRATASPRLAAFVEGVLPLTLVVQEGDRSLYVVRQNRAENREPRQQ